MAKRKYSAGRSFKPSIAASSTKANTGYRFIDKDPILDELNPLIEDQMASGRVTKAQIERESGVCASTVNAWLNGKTRRPQNATIDFVLKAMGFHRPIRRL